MPPCLQQDAVVRMGHGTQWSRFPSSHPLRFVVAPHARGSHATELNELIKLWAELAPKKWFHQEPQPKIDIPDADTRK